MPWFVRTVRFTSFLIADTQVPRDAWAAVVGGEPEAINYQRTIGLRVESGPFLDSNAALTVQICASALMRNPRPSRCTPARG